MHHVSLLVCSYTRKEKYLVLLLERLLQYISDVQVKENLTL